MDLSALLSFDLGFSTFEHDPLWLPAAAAESEGYDIRYCGGAERAPVVLAPREEAVVGTGLFVTQTFPKHVAMLILPRSSTGKRSLSLRNGVPLIDRAYIGREIMLMLRNDGQVPQTIEHGERIAQMVFTLCAHPRIVQTVPSETVGRAGFGSTGRF
jgi:dUTP pyrophosphatase